MRFEDLSVEDQKLVNTDFGDLEKEASEKLAEANEVYAYGQEQAHAVADQMDEAMAKFASEEEEEEDDKEELDEESEKKAAELGAFIERGFFDELTKLGSERHDDPAYYYYPYMEEKIAQMGAEEKLAGWREALKETASKIKTYAGKAKDRVVDYHKGIKKDIMDAATGAPKQTRVKNPGKKGPKTKTMTTKLTTGERVKSGLTAAGKMVPHAAALGLTGYGVKKALD